MATISTLPAQPQQQTRDVRAAAAAGAALPVGLAVAAGLLLGYHPGAEDGGVYSAAAALRLNPSLFPADRAFAVAHTGNSLFIPLLAELTRTLHLPLEWTLLLVYTVSLVATMLAAAALCRVLFRTVQAQRWALVMLAVSLGLPAAGTSLYLADPYLTARSVSTPFLLAGLALLLRDRRWAAAGCLAVAFTIHPLMAVWAALLLGIVMAVRSARPVAATMLFTCVTLAAMAAVAFFAPVDGEALRAASLSRDYWFVVRWHWYEIVGLAAPPLLLSVLALRYPSHPDRGVATSAARHLAAAVAVATVVVAVGAVLFVHPGNSSFLLARTQPLRLLHPVYLVFALLGGGLLVEIPHRRGIVLRWSAVAVAGVSLLAMQLHLYSASDHMELPGHAPANAYQQAFRWVRENTPQNAVFAVDANYTTEPGEDAQVMRAATLRSTLPDAAKDGGISSVVPALAPAWQRAAQAQTGLNAATDAQRLERLRPLGATWLLLPATASTAFDCPYTNTTAKICRLP